MFFGHAGLEGFHRVFQCCLQFQDVAVRELRVEFLISWEPCVFMTRIKCDLAHSLHELPSCL